MLPSGRFGDVDVLADLDEAVGAEDRQPAVAPGREAVGREPVDAHVSGAAIAAQHHVAEVLEPRVLRVIEVPDLRGHDVGARRAGEEEELIGLVRADVAEDAAVALALEEPRRTRLEVGPVRSQADRLHDAADRPRLHQLAGLDRGAVLEPLAVHDRVDALGLGLDLAHFGQLLERRDARLVDQVVLAVLHHANAERAALVGDGGADDELQRLVLEDLRLAARDLDVRMPLDERGDELGLLRVHRHELAAAALHRGDLPVDVPVVEADDAELDVRRRLTRDGRAESGCRQRHDGRGRSGDATNELTPTDARCLHCRRSRGRKRPIG